MGGGFLVGGGGGGGLRGVPASKFLSDGGSGGGLERDALMGVADRIPDDTGGGDFCSKVFTVSGDGAGGPADGPLALSSESTSEGGFGGLWTGRGGAPSCVAPMLEPALDSSLLAAVK